MRYSDTYNSHDISIPLMDSSLLCNCYATIMHSLYNHFRMQLDTYSFEYQNLIRFRRRGDTLRYIFTLLFSLSRDKAKNDKIEAKRNRTRTKEIGYFDNRLYKYLFSHFLSDN